MNLLDVKTHIPWIVYDAKEWMDELLNNEMKVFEWGSGGSTLYFAKKVKEVVSVEHNKTWFDNVQHSITKNNINNCKYYLIEPEFSIFAKFLPYISSAYVSRTFKEHEKMSFKNYVKKIDSFPDEYFDLIFVDGRSRVSCIDHAVKKIKKKGGFLVLDNSERELYLSLTKKLNKFERIDFFGNGPYIEDVWQTSIWKIV